MKTAVVIGATSGLGRALAVALSAAGFTVGATGRREHLLASLQEEIAGPVFTQQLDVTSAHAGASLEALLQRMGGVDLVVISAGTGSVEAGLPWAAEKLTIETNVLGFTAMANVAYHHFEQRGAGHLVGISSVAAVRGGPVPAYNASKAYVSNYLQGLRLLAVKSGLAITITDVKPGFVDTAMAQAEKPFWMVSAEVAAQQILEGIAQGREHLYVTKRWRLVAWLLKSLPDFLYHRL
jgi:short-subunit dehydrogenase